MKRFAQTLLLVTTVACSSEPDATPQPVATAGAAGAATGGAGSGGVATSGASAGGASGTAGLGAGGTFTAGSGGTSGASAGAAGNGGSAGAGPQMSPGEVAFRTNCLPCHGELGAGTLMGPDIQHPIRDYATWVVRNGRPMSSYVKPMMAWPQDKLSDADLVLIFDYLDTPPKGTTGEALFRDFCANCHGADAKGGVVKHDLTNETNEIPTRVRMGAHAGEFQEREEFMPVFSTTILSDAEVQLIQSYVESL